MQLWGLLWGLLPQTSQFRHPAHCQALRATAARDGLEVQWQEHELGSYPTIVLLWEDAMRGTPRSEEHTSELQSRGHLVCRLLLEKKKNNKTNYKSVNM